MKVFQITINLFFCFALAACSSTSQVNLDNESNHYYAKEFSHHEFTVHNKDSIKKAASSDQQLMLSLLNRPMPEDQRMMLAFAKRQETYFPDSTIVGIQIKGDKSQQEDKTRVSSQYAHIIKQDINSVAISAMPK